MASESEISHLCCTNIFKRRKEGNIDRVKWRETWGKQKKVLKLEGNWGKKTKVGRLEGNREGAAEARVIWSFNINNGSRAHHVPLFDGSLMKFDGRYRLR
jgi:hypothetical protein